MSAITTTHTSEPATATRRSPTIVVGYDGSPASRAALRVATRQATPSGRVLVVHAYDLPPDDLGYPEYGYVLAHHHADGETLLDAVTLSARGDIEYETELLGGPAAQVLQSVARIYHADEIVIGVGGGDAAGEPFGVITRELLRIADQPVILVAPAEA